jgi:Rod binding domain-containing protein
MVNKIPTVGNSDPALAFDIASRSGAAEKLKSASNQDVKSTKDVEKAAKGFEALLLQEMMQSMWSTVEFAGMFKEESNESQIYRDMFSQAIADTTAEGRGIGVKEFLSKELLRKNHASK